MTALVILSPDLLASRGDSATAGGGKGIQKPQGAIQGPWIPFPSLCSAGDDNSHSSSNSRGFLTAEAFLSC